MFLVLPAVSVVLLWVSSVLYTRRRPGGLEHDRKFVVLSALAPAPVLLLWVVFWILPGWVLPGLAPLPPAVFSALELVVALPSLAWFLVETLVFLLVPVYRPRP